jgi:hypothetical protein
MDYPEPVDAQTMRTMARWFKSFQGRCRVLFLSIECLDRLDHPSATGRKRNGGYRDASLRNGHSFGLGNPGGLIAASSRGPVILFSLPGPVPALTVPASTGAEIECEFIRCPWRYVMADEEDWFEDYAEGDDEAQEVYSIACEILKSVFTEV